MSFPFFALPLELREAIYAYFIISYPVSHPLSGLGIASVSHRPPPTSLLLACKQLCTEALNCFYALSTWKIILTHAFNFFRTDPQLSHLAASPHFQHMRRFELVYLCERDLLAEYPSFGIDRFCEVMRERSTTACEVLVQAPRLSTAVISWIDDTDMGAWSRKAETLMPLKLLSLRAAVSVGTVAGPEDVDHRKICRTLLEQFMPRGEMDQLEIHSKSYLIRWLYVSGGHTIGWSLQPHKRSLNFGVFKHPGTGSSLAPSLYTSTTGEVVPTPGLDQPTRPRRASLAISRSEHSTVVEKLQSIGLRLIVWVGKCEADKVSVGSYDVPEGEGGMYGLVFDNTFSKQTSKTVTFVPLTYPTTSPPKSGHNLRFSDSVPLSRTTSTNSNAQSLRLESLNDSTDTLPAEGAVLYHPRPKNTHTTESKSSLGSTFFTGVLRKKRRRRNQGWARRFFSLDFTSSTLSYYQNRNSSALRGSIPLALAAISTDDKSREISVDSGAEVWHLRAGNQKDFEAWKDALERAARSTAALQSSQAKKSLSAMPPPAINPAEDREWARVESLASRVAGTRDAVRRLAKDTDPKYQPAVSGFAFASPSPTESLPNNDYFKEDEKQPDRRPFWKRKPSSNAGSPSAVFRRSSSAQHTPVLQPLVTQSSNGSLNMPQRPRSHTPSPNCDSIHEHCMALLRNLDSVVAEFSALIAESKQRRRPGLSRTLSRQSIESTTSQEFFDAEDGYNHDSQLLTLRRDSDRDEGKNDDEESSDSDDSASSMIEDATGFRRRSREGHLSFFPDPPKSLTPLPLERVTRRHTLSPAAVPPPSLVGFLRKNVGKDLSTIAMPVSSNEPLSLLQRTAEHMEYSTLLDAAASVGANATERLLYVTAFAISPLSNSRCKERALRKPFNPMLGETFELVREDRGFRFIAEKVSHRPVRVAFQAEAKEWSFTQSPMPTQKFWGKSAEVSAEGRARVALHRSGEQYSWTGATCFLRNIIAGEKYLEPVHTMTVVDETSGAKAVVTFKSKGMFSGRSEDVVVHVIDAHGDELAQGLVGKWTSHLNLALDGADTGKTIWTVGELVENAQSRYGFTDFAASLNEITPIEDSHLAVTDSRLRPDQRAWEDGHLDQAEALKARLEERQRGRRRVYEEHGKEMGPRWFVRVGDAEKDGEEVWRLKGGKDGYWECRAEGRWDGVVDVFEH